jgi:RHS repeat-associated protein
LDRSASAADNTQINASTKHGFTFHEHLTNLGLINMQGRVFDPVIGRFMSADPFVQAPYNAQSLNRYSYTFNNPLSYTDPTGFNACDHIIAEGNDFQISYQHCLYDDPAEPDNPVDPYPGATNDADSGGGEHEPAPTGPSPDSTVGGDETECTFLDTLSDAVLAWASDNLSLSIQGTTLGSTTGEYNNYNSFSVGITSGLQVYASSTQVASSGSLRGYRLPSGQSLSAVGAASVGFNVGTSSSLLQSGVSVQDYVGAHAYLGRGGSFELQTDASSTQGSLMGDARLRSLEVGVGLGADLIRGKVKTFSAASGPVFGLGPTQFSGCARKK